MKLFQNMDEGDGLTFTSFGWVVLGIILCFVLLSGCATTPQIIYQDRPVEVKVPVAQPCVSGVRPIAPKPLNQQYTADQWKALDPKQKAAIVSKHALDLKTYGENINGATASCP